MRPRAMLYFLLAFVATLGVAQAFCPCIVAAAAGIAVARYLDINDIVTGLWIGAMLYLTGIWTEDEIKKYLRKRNRYDDYARHKKIAMHLALVYGITAVSMFFLWYFDYFSGFSVIVYGMRINSLLLGTLMGVVLTLFTSLANRELWNLGIKVRFQKTALIVAVLLAFSALLWGFY
jgi:hypothetical protein